MDQRRDNKWLTEKLFQIWEDYFNDVPRKNLVLIKFGKSSKRQLGCIRMANHKTKGISKDIENLKVEDDQSISVITITKYFQNLDVPEYVVDGTIMHEMCHYAHGFNSPLQQLFDHPHKGGVIRKEMAKRGLGETYKQANKWLKENWRKVVAKKK